MSMTYGQLLQDATNKLEAAGVDDAAYDAFSLFEYAFHMNRAQYLVKSREEVDNSGEYLELIKRRAGHEPLQYITGSQCFYGLDYYVDNRVLIPRYDTEVVVENILSAEKADNLDVLDICTGSGCIAITLASNRPSWKVTGSDISEGALEVSAINKDKLNVHNVSFVHSDLLCSIEGQFDIIVSNPPYIERKVIEGLTSEVKDHEPMLALCGGDDGLDLYKRIIKDAVGHLKAGGRLYFEIGYNQGQAVSELLKEYGYNDIRVQQDLAGKDRMVSGSLN